jgi:RNA polymerase sigma factor (sigma-70 family)
MDGTAARADLELLAEFARSRGEEVFAELVRRHSRLVYNLCRRVLDDRQEAEDATQTVFLALVRHAATLEGDTVLPAWLHRVALNVSRNARAARTARREREQMAGAMQAPDDAGDSRAWSELRGELDESLDELPEKHRRAVILFHFQGLSMQETARALGSNEGTIGYWLACGREGLRRRLSRRGVTISVGALAACLSKYAQAAEIPAGLIQPLAYAARLAELGQGTVGGAAAVPAAACGKGALAATTAIKLKTAAVVIAAAGTLGLVGYGVGNQATRLTKAVEPPAAEPPVSTPVAAPSDAIPLGHPDFYPTPERPVGFRGDGSGGFPGAKGLVTEWDDRTGKNIIWKCEMPDFSQGGCVVVGDKVFTQADPATLLCVDAHTGKLLWEREHWHATWLDALPKDQREEAIRLWRGLTEARMGPGFAGPHSLYPEATKVYPEHRTAKRRAAGMKAEGCTNNYVIKYPKAAVYSDWWSVTGFTASTPVSDGRYVWVKSGVGVVACYDLEGNRIWYRTFDTEPWVNYRSPLLAGGKLIVSHELFAGRNCGFFANHVCGCPTDPQEAAVLGEYKQRYKDGKQQGSVLDFPADCDPEMITALDPYTGKTLWQTRMAVGGWFGSGGITRMRIGDTDLIVTAHGGILRASDGKMLRPDEPYGVYGVCDAPVVAPGGLTVWPRVSKVELNGPDTVTVAAIDRYGFPQSKWRSLAVYEGRVCSPGGSFFDLSMKKGGRLIRPEEPPKPCRGDHLTSGPYGCVIAADGKLYVPAMEWGFMVYDIAGTQSKFLANNSLEMSDTHFLGYPFAQGNRLYVRGPLFLWCLGDPAAPYHRPAKPAKRAEPVKAEVADPGPDVGRRLEYEIKAEELFSTRASAMSGISYWHGRGSWRVLEPLAITPPKGTPVTTCVGDRSSPSRWLIAGPFPVKSGPPASKKTLPGPVLVYDDPADTPKAKVVPEVGASVKFGGQAKDFQPVEMDVYRTWHRANGEIVTAIDVGKALAGQSGCIYLGSWFHAADSSCLSYAIERSPQRAGKPPVVAVWIGGTQYWENTPIRLRPGYYSLLIQIEAGEAVPREAGCGVGLSFSRLSEDPWVRLHRETLDNAVRLCPDSEYGKKAREVLDFDANCKTRRTSSAAGRRQDDTDAAPISPTVVRIEAAAGFTPDEGAPVFEYQNGAVIGSWLYAGPFTRNSGDEDCLRALGGRAVARPKAGTQVDRGDRAIVFTPLENKHFWRHERFTADLEAIIVAGQDGLSQVWNSTMYFYSVLKNDKPRQAQFFLLTPGGENWHGPEHFADTIWLSGTPVQILDTLSIPEGLFPLMIEVSYGVCEKKDSRFWIAPRFQDVLATCRQ